MKKVAGLLIGKCPICSRDMISGSSVNEHHFKPKSRSGKAEDKIMLHRVCHDKLHRIFTEKELELHYNTPEKCIEHDEIKKIVKWLTKKHPEFVDKVIISNNKKSK